MTLNEAKQHFIQEFSRNIAVLSIDKSHCEMDDVTTFSAKILDLDTSATGWAVFDVHWGQIEVTWD